MSVVIDVVMLVHNLVSSAHRPIIGFTPSVSDNQKWFGAITDFSVWRGPFFFSKFLYSLVLGASWLISAEHSPFGNTAADRLTWLGVTQGSSDCRELKYLLANFLTFMPPPSRPIYASSSESVCFFLHLDSLKYGVYRTIIVGFPLLGIQSQTDKHDQGSSACSGPFHVLANFFTYTA